MVDGFEWCCLDCLSEWSKDVVVYSINIAYLFSEVAIGGRERPSPDVLEELTAVVQLCRIVVQYFVCLLSFFFFFMSAWKK